MRKLNLVAGAIVMAAMALSGHSAMAQATAATQSVLVEGARTADPLPVETYVKRGEYRDVQLSANGRYLVAAKPINGKYNLVVIDLETRSSKAVTGFEQFDVIDFHWVGSSYLVFSLGTYDSPTGKDRGLGGGLFAVRADGSGARTLSDTFDAQVGKGAAVYRGYSFSRTVPGSETDIIATGNLRSQDSPDVYRIDLNSGKANLLTFEQPGRVDYWVTDSQGQPRVAVVGNRDDVAETETFTKVLVRDSATANWRELAHFKFRDPKAWSPVAFTADEKSLIVRARPEGRDTSALYTLDLASGQMGDLLIGHPHYDASEISLQRNPGGQVVGAIVRDDRVQVAHFDLDYARIQAGMEKVFKDRAVIVQRTEGARALVMVYSDRHPPAYYLYDEKSRKLELALKSREDLNENHLVEMRPFMLKTRDGLEIPSYYFLPKSYQPGQRLPTVVHIHGGPAVRADRWAQGFGYMEAQLLASRGYAVVLPNYRITPGLGKKIERAGDGTVGRQMSDDHEDAARWAVQQGFADEKRICMSGASYGGYATLWASIRSSDVFKCGVAGLVVSDMKLQLTSPSTDFSGSDGALSAWKRMLGVKGDDWGPANAVSPALHAERSNMPLFIYAGDADRRTPIEQTYKMVDALKRVGKPPEQVFIAKNEGHGFGKVENNVALYEAVLKFLDRHIGGGPAK